MNPSRSEADSWEGDERQTTWIIANRRTTGIAARNSAKQLSSLNPRNRSTRAIDARSICLLGLITIMRSALARKRSSDGHVLPFREQSASTDVSAGLCASCKHATRVPSAKGSTFVRCDLSLSDASFARYPRLPKVQCSGFVANDSDAAQTK